MSTAVGNSLSDVVTSGEFQRRPSQFRNWIRADGSTEFLPESGRYHLYVSLACPWAQRTLIVRALKGLESHIGVSVVNWRMRERGWTFDPAPGVIPDTINNCATMPDLYKLARPDYEGRFTVPVLWDKKLRTIVNNESSEIIRMLNKEFNHIAGNPELDLYPAELASGIDKWNDLVYNSINNGVYRCGFATTQEAYEKAFDALFAGLQTVEEHLNSHRYLCGSRLTEADIRLFTTLVRFDAVYYGHFKCNLRRLADYPNLSGLMRELYQLPKVAATVNLHHIKHHYYESHPSINPTGIVPKGPLLDFSAPPGRLHLHAEPICFAATRNVESP